MQSFLVMLVLATSISAWADSSTTQILFDGSDLSQWVGKTGETPTWHMQDDYVEVEPGSGDITTKMQFGDFDLHIEFWLPLVADKWGQDRANSGIFLQGLYEIQILDSYENPTYYAGSCGSLYKAIAANPNASLPPEHWQTYEIHFVAPRFDATGEMTQPGEVTVVHNGITVIDAGRFSKPTGSRGHEKQTGRGPLVLQDHGNRVRFRNIRLTPLP